MTTDPRRSPWLSFHEAESRALRLCSVARPLLAEILGRGRVPITAITAHRLFQAAPDRVETLFASAALVEIVGPDHIRLHPSDGGLFETLDKIRVHWPALAEQLDAAWLSPPAGHRR